MSAWDVRPVASHRRQGNRRVDDIAIIAVPCSTISPDDAPLVTRPGLRHSPPMSEDRVTSLPVGAEDTSRTVARLRHVLASITEGYFVLDAGFRFVEVNETARRAVFRDVPREEMLGRAFWEVFPEGRTSEFFRQCHRAMETGRDAHFEARSHIVPRWFETHVFPHPEEGRVEVFVRDVSDRKRAEEALEASEREFRAVFELSATGAAQTDAATGCLLRVNRRFCEIVGYPEEELLGRTFDEITHPDDRIRAAETTWPVLRGERESFEIEKRYMRKDGRVVWVMVAGRLIRDADGRPFRSIATIVDVTTRREVENRLREADRRKDEFLATLAHELRNPLAPIRYAARLLRPDSPPAAITQVRDTLERQSTQMARLLDDLLDVSRITRNVIELKREALDLRQAVEDSVEVARPLIDAVHHRLVVSLPGKPVWVEADRTRLSQIVANLLQNAAKYTDPGGRIEVGVEQQAEAAVLRVRDSGIGIAPEMRERVFEIFSQVHRPGDATRSGLGIGLAIVKRLVELHGGRIEVTSEGLGKGAEFTVRLPLATPQAGLPLNVVPLFASGRRRLLVVDDNRDAADSLAAMLRLSGHAVQVAYDGASAMALAETVRPDVMLLDLGMPQTSGYDVARWVRRQPWGAGVKLIALTGWGQDEDRRRTREAGFDLHLTKPVDPDQLVAMLDDDEAHREAQGK